MSGERLLPSPHRLRALYVNGASLAELAEMHGLTTRTAVYNTMRRDAVRLDLPWPLKVGDRANVGAHKRHLDTVLAEGVRQEILNRPETRTVIAELSGVPRQTIEQVASGRRKRIRRITALKIMRAIDKLEAET